MSAIVAVVVVGAEACCCRQIVGELIGEVDLCAIDVLLALHLGIELVGGDDGGNALGLLIHGLCQRGDDTTQQCVEHGYSVVVLYETTTAHNANHG